MMGRVVWQRRLEGDKSIRVTIEGLLECDDTHLDWISVEDRHSDALNTVTEQKSKKSCGVCRIDLAHTYVLVLYVLQTSVSLAT